MRAAIIGALISAVFAAMVVAPVRAADGQVAMIAPFKVDRVVVLKSQRELVLMSGDYVLRVYRVALGRNAGGPKMFEGDGRTPEGTYTLDFKLRDSAFYKAIHISYPNETDVARAESFGLGPGGKIMIHGLPNDMTAERVGHPEIDWTEGCIAVANDEIDEIWQMVETGTPIEILP
jgi:murein L,D-transpeptidase YafK